MYNAISYHETKNCTIGVGKTHNNCTGIKRKGKFVRYKTQEDHKQDFIRVWDKYYGKYPTLKEARIWSGSDRYYAWLRSVNKKYNEI